MSDNRTDHTTLGGSTFCSPSLQGVWCCKNVTLNHAKAWQLIVNELSSNAKALNLLYFLKKIKAYAHIFAHLHTLCTSYAHKHAQTQAGGQAAGGGMGYVCMNKYTDGYFQLLTTLVTDKNKRY